jgi:hypothetical protein
MANDGPQGTTVCNQALSATTDNNNFSFKANVQGSPCLAAYAADKPHISTSRYYVAPGDTTTAPRRSLKLSLPPRPGKLPNGAACFTGSTCAIQAGPDVAELLVHDGVSQSSEELYGVGFNFENPKFFGFAMQIASSSGPLKSPVKFMRVVQQGTCGVPLSAKLESVGSSFKFSLDASDNAGSRQILAPTTLLADKWYRFVFFLSPHSQETVATDVEGGGTVMLWLGGEQDEALTLLLDWRGRDANGNPAGDFGCKPVAPFNTDSWTLNVGPYRDANKIFPESLYLYFDNIRVTPRKDQADPITMYPWW